MSSHQLETTNAVHVVKFTEGKRKLDSFFYPLDRPAPQITGKLVDFYNLWQNTRKDGKLPSWKDFSFENFVGWHSKMRVMETGKDINDVKHNIIVGETFAKYWGRNTLYDQIQSANPPTQDTINKYYQHLGHLYNKHYCISAGIIPNEDGSLCSTTWIELPLADNGKDVSHFIAAILAV